jgi:hypothetical protein
VAPILRILIGSPLGWSLREDHVIINLTNRNAPTAFQIAFFFSFSTEKREKMHCGGSW